MEVERERWWLAETIEHHQGPKQHTVMKALPGNVNTGSWAYKHKLIHCAGRWMVSKSCFWDFCVCDIRRNERRRRTNRYKRTNAGRSNRWGEGMGFVKEQSPPAPTGETFFSPGDSLNTITSLLKRKTQSTVRRDKGMKNRLVILKVVKKLNPFKTLCSVGGELFYRIKGSLQGRVMAVSCFLFLSCIFISWICKCWDWNYKSDKEFKTNWVSEQGIIVTLKSTWMYYLLSGVLIQQLSAIGNANGSFSWGHIVFLGPTILFFFFLHWISFLT